MAKYSMVYEKVYTGEFLGEWRFDSLLNLQLFSCFECLMSIIYLVLEFLHLTRLKGNVILVWFLRAIDIFLVIFSVCYYYYIRQL
ncbi:hypothetical protein DW103_06480 [Parabacteroides sp. AM08-6]|nr:hypothetical protein DW103_06480 [Parabacteroides sp. AM08-6]